MTQSSKPTRYSWNVVLFGVIAFAVLLLQRFTGTQTANGHNPFLQQRQFADTDSNNAMYHIYFPSLTPLMTSAALAYHTNSPALAVIASWPLWLTTHVCAQALPAVIDFNNPLALNLGFMLQGGAANDSAGYSVANAGDVNGDGKSDFIIGAVTASPGGRSYAGAAYLIYGAASLPTTINLANLGTAGVTLQGGAAGDRTGWSVAGAGDVNGDGKSDFIIGAYKAAPSGRSQAGAAYLIYGAANLPTTIDLASLAVAGVTLQGGAPGDYTGTSIASAGDINGDGGLDLLIGASLASPDGRSKAGAVYVIYGPTPFNRTSMTGPLSTQSITSALTTLASVATYLSTVDSSDSSPARTTRGDTVSTLAVEASNNTVAANLPVIIGGTAGGVLGLGVALAACGIWCKKRRPESTTPRKSELAESPTQSDNHISSAKANYGKIDEFKNANMQYDHPPLAKVDDLKMTI